MALRILVVDNDPDVRSITAELFDLVKAEVSAVDSLEAAATALDRARFDLVVTALFGARHEDHLASGRRILELARPTPVVVHTGWGVNAEELAKIGLPYLAKKPTAFDELLATVGEVARLRTLGEDDPRQVAIRAYFRGLGSDDLEAWGQLLTDDVEYELPSNSSYGRTVRGRGALVEFTRAVFAQFPECSFEEVVAYELPEGIAARYLGTWRGPDGTRQQQSGAVYFQFEGAAIRHIGVRLDDRGLVERAGESRV